MIHRQGESSVITTWGSGSVCVSLMSHVLVLIVLELYSFLCSLVTSSRIGKAGVRMLYITAAILYQSILKLEFMKGILCILPILYRNR